jgi:hypothetical protein
MKYITKIITYVTRTRVATPQGRWEINYCNIKTGRKIDLANEDHCGTCSEYAHSKFENKPNETNNKANSYKNKK